jgi:flagellar biosynthetic protein FliO
VTGLNKKSLVLLAVVLLGAGTFIVYSAQSPADKVESEKTRPEPNRPQVETESKNIQLFKNDPNFFYNSDYSPLGGEFSVRAILAVLFVLALFIAAIYVSKKLLPRITNLPGREIRIVETVHLGPRKAVHVLEVDNRRFLIGSTNENVSKLAELGGELTGLTKQEANYNRDVQ